MTPVIEIAVKSDSYRIAAVSTDHHLLADRLQLLILDSIGNDIKYKVLLVLRNQAFCERTHRCIIRIRSTRSNQKYKGKQQAPKSNLSM